jgi:hypothetical protein
VFATHDPRESLAKAPYPDADCLTVSASAALGATDHGRAKQEEGDAMREIEIHTYARQLLEAHGPRAIAEAAQNAIELESNGETELARTWRHIEDAMKQMRGPHQS